MILDAIVLGLAMLFSEIAIKAFGMPETKGFRALVFVTLSVIWTTIRVTLNF